MYDYAAGKADWGSFGLPLEGNADSSTRVGSVVRADAPTCGLDELVADVAERIGDAWELCVVINGDDVVQGVLDQAALRAKSQTRADDAMHPGPRTIRPSARKEVIRKRFRDQGLTSIVVTHSDGVYVGVLRSEDLG